MGGLTLFLQKKETKNVEIATSTHHQLENPNFDDLLLTDRLQKTKNPQHISPKESQIIKSKEQAKIHFHTERVQGKDCIHVCVCVFSFFFFSKKEYV